MARAARDRGAGDAAQTRAAAAMASAAQRSARLFPAGPQSRPAPPASRPRPARGTFPGVPGNYGPGSPAPCRGGPGRTQPSRPPSLARDRWDHPSGETRGHPSPNPTPTSASRHPKLEELSIYSVFSVLFTGPAVQAKLWTLLSRGLLRGRERTRWDMVTQRRGRKGRGT